MMHWVLPLAFVAVAGCTLGSNDAPPSEARLQASLLSGTVIDDAGLRVADAQVTMTQGNATTRTDAEGAFSFPDVAPGTYVMRVEKAWFLTAEAEVKWPAADDVRIVLPRDPQEYPYWVPTVHDGFLACGFAVQLTSIGCSSHVVVEDATSTVSSWPHHFERADVRWTQGELVWDAGLNSGMLIWEIAPFNNNFHARSVQASPALVLLDDTYLATHDEAVVEGVEYRFYGGPHPACQLPTGGFGCGVTINQEVEAFIHDFYNHLPPEGWRYTSQGDPPRL